jgi:hypothetical protein
MRRGMKLSSSAPLSSAAFTGWILPILSVESKTQKQKSMAVPNWSPSPPATATPSGPAPARPPAPAPAPAPAAPAPTPAPTRRAALPIALRAQQPLHGRSRVCPVRHRRQRVRVPSKRAAASGFGPAASFAAGCVASAIARAPAFAATSAAAAEPHPGIQRRPRRRLPQHRHRARLQCLPEAEGLRVRAGGAQHNRRVGQQLSVLRGGEAGRVVEAPCQPQLAAPHRAAAAAPTAFPAATAAGTGAALAAACAAPAALAVLAQPREPRGAAAAAARGCPTALRLLCRLGRRRALRRQHHCVLADQRLQHHRAVCHHGFEVLGRRVAGEAAEVLAL